MALPLPAGSIVECQLRSRLDGQQTITSFYYQIEADIADMVPAMNALMDIFNTEVAVPISTIQSQDVIERTVTAQAVYPIRYVILEQEAIPNIGAVITPACPSGTSLVVRRRSELAGKKYRGRIYIPGIPFADTFESQMTDAWMLANTILVGDTVTTDLTDALGNQYTPIIFNLKAPANRTEVAQYDVDPILRYQRRREIGKGV